MVKKANTVILISKLLLYIQLAKEIQTQKVQKVCLLLKCASMLQQVTKKNFIQVYQVLCLQKTRMHFTMT